ncbi:MAG: histidine phosphatase family protein [Vicinamibacterales bacterium]
MTTRLYLVRHGATPLTAEDRFSGADGVDLSEEGRAQADRLAGRLADERIDAVYASPYSRAMETARILSRGWTMGPVPDERLREIGHGHWEGMKRSDVEARFAAEYSMWSQDPFTFAPEGGESGVAVLTRALPSIRDIVVRHQGKHVLVVSHKATIRLVLCSLLGIDARGYRDRLDQAPACLNILDFSDPVRARLTLFNDTSHYETCPAPTGRHISKWWG